MADSLAGTAGCCTALPSATLWPPPMPKQIARDRRVLRRFEGVSSQVDSMCRFLERRSLRLAERQRYLAEEYAPVIGELLQNVREGNTSARRRLTKAQLGLSSLLRKPPPTGSISQRTRREPSVRDETPGQRPRAVTTRGGVEEGEEGNSLLQGGGDGAKRQPSGEDLRSMGKPMWTRRWSAWIQPSWRNAGVAAVGNGSPSTARAQHKASLGPLQSASGGDYDGEQPYEEEGWAAIRPPARASLLPTHYARPTRAASFDSTSPSPPDVLESSQEATASRSTRNGDYSSERPRGSLAQTPPLKPHLPETSPQQQQQETKTELGKRPPTTTSPPFSASPFSASPRTAPARSLSYFGDAEPRYTFVKCRRHRYGRPPIGAMSMDSATLSMESTWGESQPLGGLPPVEPQTSAVSVEASRQGETPAAEAPPKEADTSDVKALEDAILTDVETELEVVPDRSWDTDTDVEGRSATRCAVYDAFDGLPHPFWGVEAEQSSWVSMPNPAKLDPELKVLRILRGLKPEAYPKYNSILLTRHYKAFLKYGIFPETIFELWAASKRPSEYGMPEGEQREARRRLSRFPPSSAGADDEPVAPDEKPPPPPARAVDVAGASEAAAASVSSSDAEGASARRRQDNSELVRWIRREAERFTESIRSGLPPDSPQPPPQPVADDMLLPCPVDPTWRNVYSSRLRILLRGKKKRSSAEVLRELQSSSSSTISEEQSFSSVNMAEKRVLGGATVTDGAVWGRPAGEATTVRGGAGVERSDVSSTVLAHPRAETAGGGMLEATRRELSFDERAASLTAARTVKAAARQLRRTELERCRLPLLARRTRHSFCESAPGHKAALRRLAPGAKRRRHSFVDFLPKKPLGSPLVDRFWPLLLRGEEGPAKAEDLGRESLQSRRRASTREADSAAVATFEGAQARQTPRRVGTTATLSPESETSEEGAQQPTRRASTLRETEDPPLRQRVGEEAYEEEGEDERQRGKGANRKSERTAKRRRTRTAEAAPLLPPQRRGSSPLSSPPQVVAADGTKTEPAEQTTDRPAEDGAGGSASRAAFFSAKGVEQQKQSKRFSDSTTVGSPLRELPLETPLPLRRSDISASQLRREARRIRRAALQKRLASRRRLKVRRGRRRTVEQDDVNREGETWLQFHQIREVLSAADWPGVPPLPVPPPTLLAYGGRRPGAAWPSLIPTLFRGPAQYEDLQEALLHILWSMRDANKTLPPQPRRRLKLWAGGFMIPHDEKRFRYGDDAWFCSEAVGCLGVCDGVGEMSDTQWRVAGFDCRGFGEDILREARARIHTIRTARRPLGCTKPQIVLPAGCTRSDKQWNRREFQVACNEPASRTALEAMISGYYGKETTWGAATCLIGCLNAAGTQVGFANIGDSRALVLRRGAFSAGALTIAGGTEPEQHGWNLPVQLARLPDRAKVQLMRQDPRLSDLVRTLDASRATGQDINDPPESAVCYDYNVQAGDLIVIATDGLWDNLFDSELAALCGIALSPLESELMTGNAFMSTAPRDIAKGLCLAAYWRSLQPDIETPFTRSVRDAGGSALNLGGKPDDISVVAAWVVPEAHENTAELLQRCVETRARERRQLRQTRR